MYNVCVYNRDYFTTQSQMNSVIKKYREGQKNFDSSIFLILLGQKIF